MGNSCNIGFNSEKKCKKVCILVQIFLILLTQVKLMWIMLNFEQIHSIESFFNHGFVFIGDI